MEKTILASTFFTGLCFAATGAHAQTAIADCPQGHEAAQIYVKATVSTNLDGCPLLEQKELRKLVDKNLSGTVFAYPLVPGTCVSGTITEGTIKTDEGTVNVSGTTESAQRFFPEALAVNPSGGGVFLAAFSQDNIPFASGAAATIVSVQGVDLDLQLVLSDRFSLKLDSFPIIDTEDFEVVGAEGASATGRLTGIAEIYQFPPEAIDNAQFTVQGQICIK
jgi:hypothetical protein